MKLILLISIIFAGSIVFAKGKKCDDYDQYKNVELSEMQKIVNAKSATIIDVNSKKKFTKTNIPGSVNFYANKKDLSAVLPVDKNAMIVAYCGGEACLAWRQAAEKACEMGYTNIHHFKSGISGWNKVSKTKG